MVDLLVSPGPTANTANSKTFCYRYVQLTRPHLWLCSSAAHLLLTLIHPHHTPSTNSLSDTFGSASVLTLVFDAAFLLPKALSIQPGGTQEVGDLMRSRCLSRMGDNLQRRNNAAFLFGAFVLGIFLSKTFLSTRSYFFAVSVVAVAGKMQLMPANARTRSGSKKTQ